ncbi:DUF2744 domain-containing protein [Gordonia sp. PP30]|uniref:phage gene 29 protein family protein n=1 Tax=Gordonia sp. PP30 TaxID=2935861 RepID=UPI001FFFE05C|nr:DUF2744 domain-containing protein [Gordonia sp. PP30]UQE73833.1 DUF2744 domain-containing protein [Gordonia sp. PP30]
MCDLCTTPFDALTDDELDQMIQGLSVTFVALPMVVGAPLIMDPGYYLEVARHQIEAGVRICPDLAIKHYRPPADDRPLGTWIYDDAHTETETPAERIRRAVREQREAYAAEVARRRAAGDLRPETPVMKEN